MDPLSVGASIAGLLTTCVQIATLLQDFISAYSLAKEVQLEIHNFSIVLTKLTPLILGGVNINIARTSMIDLDQVIITLTGSVCLFQELDREVKRLGIAGSSNLRVRLRWTLAQSSIGDLVRQLQNHKSTLMLILQILTCDSHDLAIENMHQLQKSVQQLIDMQFDKAVGTESDRNLSQRPFASVENSSTHSSIQTARTMDSMRSTRSRVENILSRTRLYRRALVNTSNFSVTGSTRPTIGWSALSGVSLSEVSVITVYELPISLSDLYNSAPYHSPNIDAASFLLASENGEVAEASLWLELGVSIESEGENRFRAIHFASEHGRRDMVSMLLAGGADIRAHTSQGFTALHLASLWGHTDTIQLLLDNKAELDIKTTSSPYMYAWRNSLKILAGDDNDSAQTALHLAASAGHFESVGLLLTHGADIEARTAYRDTSLHLASRGGYSDTVHLLLQEGVSVDAANRLSERALDLAVSKGCVETVRILLGAGASPDGRDRELYTPLHRAVLAGVPDIVRVLLGAGAMIEARHPSMGTPLHTSATASSPEIVQILIESAANIRAKDADGQTPLMLAIVALQHKSAQTLLRGALLASETSKVAVDLVELLLDHDSSLSALTWKAIKQQIEIARSNNHWDTVRTLELYLSLG